MKPFEKCAEAFHYLDTGKLITRLTLAFLMIPHGIAKLSGLDPIVGMLANVGLPGFIAYGIYVGELLAPLMVILGFRARLGALLMAFTMVIAIGLAINKIITSYNIAQI